MDSGAPEALALGISSFVAGQTEKNAAWDDPIVWIMEAVERHSAGHTYDLSIFFDYIIPGRIVVDGTDFEGDRRGAFRRSVPQFVVAVKLPEQPPSDPHLYLAGRTRGALSVVEAWRQAQRYTDSISTARGVLDAVVRDAEAGRPQAA